MTDKGLHPAAKLFESRTLSGLFESHEIRASALHTAYWAPERTPTNSPGVGGIKKFI